MIFSLIINGAPFVLSPLLDVRHKTATSVAVFVCAKSLLDRCFSCELSIGKRQRMRYDGASKGGDGMSSIIPTCLAIHDLSCIGRASLTAIIPVLSVLGVQAVPLPTALYSNHLGFTTWHVTAIDTQRAVMDAWDANGVSIDAVYSGFLASPAQIDLVREAIDRYGQGEKLIVVDPAMADHGALYASYDRAMITAMRRLATDAGVLLPNWTEACFLTGTPYTERPAPAVVRDVAAELAGGRRLVVMTSVPVGEGVQANILYEGGTGRTETTEYTHIDRRTVGTGDLFGAAVTGLLLRGRPPGEAVRKATAFVTAAVRRLAANDGDARYGVPFECELIRLGEERDND